MKKISYLSIAAALALASCSQDDLMDNGISGDNGNAITFESYLGKSAQSRATVVTTESLYKEGFTVDAYYTETDDFSPEATGSEFMKGTKVTYNSDKKAWTYSPVKYWPNNTDDKISFFAYGPYGNTNIVRNTTTVSSIDFTVQNDVLNQVDFIYNKQEKGKEYYTLNKIKPTVSEKVKFQFQHALSRIGFTVAAAVDETSVGKVKLDGNSRINVKKVALVSGDVNTYTDDAAGPFYKSGTLDMLDGTWSNYSETTQAFTFAGKERFYRSVQDDDVATPDKIDVVQLHKFNQSQRLLNDDSYLMIIPTDNSENTDAKTSFKIYIEYDVITEDDANADVSKITNKILSAETLDVKFEAGKAYNFNLILGMTSVKFDVDKVVDWDDADNTDEWLPGNEEAPVWEEETQTFLIYNAAQLATMRDKINKGETYSDSKARVSIKYAEASYKQMADIDLSGFENWTPIGNSDSYSFKGKYDGQEHKIKGLKLNNQNSEVYAGLFGYVKDGVIENIKIVDCSMTGQHIGAIAGDNYATIKNCTTAGTVNNVEFCGGIVYNNHSTIIHCTNNISFTNIKCVGGITAYNNGNMIACGNNGNIGSAEHNGGITYRNGYNSIGHIVACYNTGAVSGTYHGGGLVGYADQTIIKASCNKGSSSNGAIIGFWDSSKTMQLDACYYSENSCNKAIGYGTLDETNNAALHAIDDTDWPEAINAMNQVLAKLYRDASESDKELYNWQYVNGSGNAPLTLETGCVEIVKKTALKGKGTEKDPYQISDAEDLNLMADLYRSNPTPGNGCVEYTSVDAYYKQTANIDFANEDMSNWHMYMGLIYEFNGHFDGCDFEIKNMHAPSENKGLFCVNNGTVKNVHFTNVKYDEAHGSVIASENYGKIIHCSCQGEFETWAQYTGAIVDWNRQAGIIIGCSFNGTFKTPMYYDAPIAPVNFGKIIGCYSSGNLISLTGNGVIYGITNDEKNVIGCYSTANFTPLDRVYPIGCDNGVANYHKATITNDKTFTNDGSIEIDGTTVTWASAVEAMNVAISEALKDLDCGNFKYVQNNDDATKEAQPYVLVEIDNNN